MTRRLFLEETIPNAVGGGVREIWEPTPEQMAELGWRRITPDDLNAEESTRLAELLAAPPRESPELRRIMKGNGHDPDATDDPDDDPREGAVIGHTSGGDRVWALAPNTRPLADPFATPTGNGAVVQPCPAHPDTPHPHCSMCEVWGKREETVVPDLVAGPKSGDWPGVPKKPSELLHERFAERMHKLSLQRDRSLSDTACTAAVDSVLKAVCDVLDERLGPA